VESVKIEKMYLL